MFVESKFSIFCIVVAWGLLYRFVATTFAMLDGTEFIMTCGVVSTMVGIIYHWDRMPSKKIAVVFGLASMFIPILGLKLLLFFWEWLFPVASILSFGFGLFAFPMISFFTERSNEIVARLGWRGVHRVEKLIGGDDKSNE